MSKKVQLFRQSGDPVEADSREAYLAEWKLFYDKAAERAKLDMLKLQRILRYGERQLVRKHNVKIEVDMPKSERAWKNLISKYDDTPIMAAKTADGKQVVLIIMDNLQG